MDYFKEIAFTHNDLGEIPDTYEGEQESHFEALVSLYMLGITCYVTQLRDVAEFVYDHIRKIPKYLDTTRAFVELAQVQAMSRLPQDQDEGKIHVNEKMLFAYAHAASKLCQEALHNLDFLNSLKDKKVARDKSNPHNKLIRVYETIIEKLDKVHERNRELHAQKLEDVRDVGDMTESERYRRSRKRGAR